MEETNKFLASVITISAVSRADSEDDDPHEDWQKQPSHCPSHMIVHGMLQEYLAIWYCKTKSYYKYVCITIRRLFSSLNLRFPFVADSRAAYFHTKRLPTLYCREDILSIKNLASTEDYLKNGLWSGKAEILHF